MSEQDAANKQNDKDRAAVEQSRHPGATPPRASVFSQGPGKSDTPPVAKPAEPAKHGKGLLSGLFHCKAHHIFGTDLVHGDIEQNQPVTEDGLFRSFMAHHPQAVREGFSYEPVRADGRTYNQIKADREAATAREAIAAERKKQEEDAKGQAKVNESVKAQEKKDRADRQARENA